MNIKVCMGANVVRACVVQHVLLEFQLCYIGACICICLRRSAQLRLRDVKKNQNYLMTIIPFFGNFSAGGVYNGHCNNIEMIYDISMHEAEYKYDATFHTVFLWVEDWDLLGMYWQG